MLIDKKDSIFNGVLKGAHRILGVSKPSLIFGLPYLSFMFFNYRFVAIN